MDAQTVVVAVCVAVALAYTVWRVWCQWRDTKTPVRPDPAAMPVGTSPSCGPSRGGCAGCSGCGSGRR